MIDRNKPLVTIAHVFGRERIYPQNSVARELIDQRELMTRKEFDQFEADGVEFEFHPLAKRV